MQRFKSSFFYIGIIGGCTALMYWIVVFGAKLEEGRNISIPDTGRSQWQEFVHSLLHNLEHPLAILLAQIVTIIFAARLFGWICKKIGQPTVIGEIFAGIVLGPSLVGMYFPEFSDTLFPPDSLGNLQFLSQIGLILFMFVIGMELDLNILKNKANDAVIISHASIIIPFALGMGLAYFIYGTFAPAGVQFTSFALFLGIAMSITAFPVLARIVQERGLHKTRLGTVVITCAAADDITAWCMLAAVIAIVKAGSFVSAFYIIALAAVYVLLMIKIVRPFLSRIGSLYQTKESLSKPIVAIFFLTLLISSYATEIIGIHALFGAFMAGAIMPDNIKFRNIFIEKVEDVSLVLLLPLFFVFTGLRTEIGLLNDASLWKITGIITLVAVVGKFVGSALAAKVVGQSWKDSLTIGALMNTRGLMELVVLNIGYDLGVLSPEIFAMMVIMALVTTLMTGPALDLINWMFKSKQEDIPQEISSINKFKILVSFGNPDRGKSLLRLANSFVKKLNGNAAVTAMHLSATNELHHYNVEEYEKESFMPIIEESEQLNQKITTLFKASNDIDADITEVANKGDYDLLLIGLGQSIFEGSLLGKILGFTTRFINPENIINQVTGKERLFENSPFDERTRNIIGKSKVPVGVLIDKNFSKADAVFIPVFSESDTFLIQFAQKLINNSGSQITILDVSGQIKNNPELKEKIRAIEQKAPNHINVLNERIIDKEFLIGQHLMVVSIESWKKLVDTKSLWLSDIPSTLIVKEGN
ncbi:MAG TPA: cation:proton antiporter [Flavobacteriales bacterium]|nr:cation:proton antiporter [Flavobacteriales bacterium]HRE97027.1 cation:proton antiporter [Flavobacteriales bacterium]HRJ39124.1 cation:proton antiporter [Flavobacteriales bacterium]